MVMTKVKTQSVLTHGAPDEIDFQTFNLFCSKIDAYILAFLELFPASGK